MNVFEVDRITDMQSWQRVVSTTHSFVHSVTRNVDDSTRIKHLMYRSEIQEMTG